MGERNSTNGVSGPPEILERIRDVLPELSGEEKLLAEYILLNYESTPSMSLYRTPSRNLFGSPTTVDVGSPKTAMTLSNEEPT